jgi:hypothetical protein
LNCRSVHTYSVQSTSATQKVHATYPRFKESCISHVEPNTPCSMSLAVLEAPVHIAQYILLFVGYQIMKPKLRRP